MPKHPPIDINWPSLRLLVIDLLLIPLALLLTIAVQTAGARLVPTLTANGLAFVAVLAIRVPVNRQFRLYRHLWRYAYLDSYFLVMGAVLAGSGLFALALFGVLTPLGLADLSPAVLAVEAAFNLTLVGSVRFLLGQRPRREITEGARTRRVLVMGAGDAGTYVARELLDRPQWGRRPVGFVDDDRAKLGMQVHGLPVLGSRADIPRLVQTYQVDEVLIAMPSAPGHVIRDVVAICEGAGVTCRTLPSLAEILSGAAPIAQIRPVQVEDLLRRDPVRVDLTAARALLRDQCVLVTGAGGSIGSELCRQIAQCDPAALVLVDKAENGLFFVQQELARRWPHLPVAPLVRDVCEGPGLASVFGQYRPQVVFHAAAHKHVPLMEANVAEAVWNNVGGTRNILTASIEHGVSHFVLISTDKAVEPSSVMGATKRIAELLVQDAAQRHGRAFVVVRFGNVLDSDGSVVPLFQRQIAAGGPVTLTHAEVTRYFMTIPEAVQLVLQATVFGQGGEIFVLDMGEPVRILDLARQLITLSGRRPDQDIPIVVTGLRPGEKLHESLFWPQETPGPTPHPRIQVARGPAAPGPQFDVEVEALLALARDPVNGDPTAIRDQLGRLATR